MNLKNMSDNLLLEKTQKLICDERFILTSLLHHLREIERRRLFSELGFKSLFDFTVKSLGYSEDQAYRRIQAMKLLTELPELENKINSGDVTLTHLGLVQTHFKQEEKITKIQALKKQKLELIEKVQGKPIKEAEKIVLSCSSKPEMHKPDKIKSLTPEYIEIKFVGSEKVQEKILKLKGLLAHKNPQISLGELFEKLCDLGLETWSPAKSAATQKRRSKKVDPEVAHRSETATETTSSLASESAPRAELESTSNEASKSFAKSASKASARKEAFQKAQNQCENCGSHYALEIDHIVPQAKGGSSDPYNLRVLCRSCNQRAAIQEFGLQKMNQYLN